MHEIDLMPTWEISLPVLQHFQEGTYAFASYFLMRPFLSVFL